MGDKSRIEWTDATWNPVTGCTKLSAGCKNCYAERMAHRLAGRCGYPQGDPFAVTLHPERFGEPIRWRKPRRVFVCSMSDLFHEDVPFEYIDMVFAVMAYRKRHTFQVLTKRPDRMTEYFQERTLADVYTNLLQSEAEERAWHSSPLDIIRTQIRVSDEWEIEDGHVIAYPREWPLPNVWLGTSIEDQYNADRRIPHLLRCPAVVRFLSCEPLLGLIDLNAIPRSDNAYLQRKGEQGVLCDDAEPCDYTYWLKREALQWVIVGGESGPGARLMNSDWLRSIRDQCVKAQVPFFFKQWGGRNAKAFGRELDGRTWDEMPGDGSMSTSQPSIQETLVRAHEVGGYAWDKVEDPDREIAEMRE